MVIVVTCRANPAPLARHVGHRHGRTAYRRRDRRRTGGASRSWWIHAEGCDQVLSATRFRLLTSDSSSDIVLWPDRGGMGADASPVMSKARICPGRPPERACTSGVDRLSPPDRPHDAGGGRLAPGRTATRLRPRPYATGGGRRGRARRARARSGIGENQTLRPHGRIGVMAAAAAPSVA